MVEHTDFIPQGLVPVSFEAAEYAVFPVPAGNGNMTLLNENVRRMWKYIFQEWLPENGRYRAAGERVGVYPINESAWMDMGQMEELEKMRRRLEQHT